ncbi:MAG: SPOR domain-containing protein [Woeseiaceae bacterium]|nr:SPOR domain-containing protein [Woeseiaceae bacterium]
MAFDRKSHWASIAMAIAGLLLMTSSVPAASPVIDASISSANGATEIRVRLACRFEVLEYVPRVSGDRLRIQIQATSLCDGISPASMRTKTLIRPSNASAAKLMDIDYNGMHAGSQEMTLVFEEPVIFDVIDAGVSDELIIRVRDARERTFENQAARAPASRVTTTDSKPEKYVVNLSSSRRRHDASEWPVFDLLSGARIFETEVRIAEEVWYRLRVGEFETIKDAEALLARLKGSYPNAWIQRSRRSTEPATTIAPQFAASTDTELPAIGLARVDELMATARKSMIAHELSQAVQIYTKVLRVRGHDRYEEAQEYLALAREKNGQKAHAKAEYERYLALYPDSESAPRIRQRLATLLAVDRRGAGDSSAAAAATKHQQAAKGASAWRTQIYASQYYRRDANQLNDEDEVVSQSALYSDINVDARRRGKRFDFSSRLSAGYRNDFLEGAEASADELRVSYAYIDIDDAKTGLRGRLGRQSRHDGGILGRFDGLHMAYQASELFVVNAVAGLPVATSADGVDSERSFVGGSVDFGPVLENLEFGAFILRQDISGMLDRQAVGTEFRYFGSTASLWGHIDYDTEYDELGSAFLQGSWRFFERSSVHASIDLRHSPFLSAGNAMIGQPVDSFSELQVLLTESEIRSLSLDRSPLTTAYTVGVSHALSPMWQVNADANWSSVEAAPASGGVDELPASDYAYYSTNVVGTSLFREGDLYMLGFRRSQSESASVSGTNLDVRIPLGSAWRINPRLRVDYREMKRDGSDEWVLTPGFRMQYRGSRKFRLELEMGKQYSQRDMATQVMDRESYFLSVGYQVFF